MEVTDVIFSFATSKLTEGVCGFAVVHIDDNIIINRVVVIRDVKEKYRVVMPNINKNNVLLPIVSIKNSEDTQRISDAVLSEFNRITKAHNGTYNKSKNKPEIKSR